MNTLSKLLNNLRRRTPVGSVQMYAGTSAPADWLMCDGSTLLIADYPKLFSVIGNTYGGNGTTSFKLPDMRDRVPVGAGNSYALNASGGSNSVSYTPSGTVGGTKLTDQQIAHGHGFTQPKLPNHVHRTGSGSSKNFCVIASRTGASGLYTVGAGTNRYSFASTSGWSDLALDDTTGNPTTLPNCTGGGVANLHGAASSRTTHTHSFTGTAATINVRQPYRGMNFIIYAGK